MLLAFHVALICYRLKAGLASISVIFVVWRRLYSGKTFYDNVVHVHVYLSHVKHDP